MSNQEEKNPSQSQENFSSGYSSESLSSPQKNSPPEKFFGPGLLLEEDSDKRVPKLNNQSSTKSESSSNHKDKNFLYQNEDNDKDFDGLSSIYPVQNENEESFDSIKKINEQIGEREEEPKKMLRKKRKKSSDSNLNSSDEE